MSGGKSGSRLNNFKNLEEIGRGGFGVVYAAERENGERVAIKKINKSAVQQRVRAEIQTMKKLRHRNIVEFYEDFIENGETYLVMELCEGGSLRNLVKQKGALDDSTAVHILRQLISAVTYMHSHSVIHRDLSAGNVFIKDSKKTKMGVKLGDFGLATNLARGETACTIVGTPGYIAPQVYGQDYTQAADVYSLGAVLYTMLTARDPPAQGPPPTCGMTRSAADLVEAMMHRDANKRIRLRDIVMNDFMKENTDEEARIYSRELSKDSRRQRSREPIRGSRDDRSQDRRPITRSTSQPVQSGRISNHPIHDRMPSTSGRGEHAQEPERGRERVRERPNPPKTRENPSIWPIRMERLAGQRIRTAGGRYIVEMDTRCRFEVASQGDVVRRILIVEYDQYRRTQTVDVHRIGDRVERVRNENDGLIDLTKNPLVYTSLSQLPKEVLNDYMRLQKMVVSNIASRVAKITFRRPSQFPDSHAQLMENGDLRIKFSKSVIVRKMENGEIYNCIDGLSSRKEAVHGSVLTKVNEIYAYLSRFEQCLGGMGPGMVCFPIAFSAGPDIFTGGTNNSPSSLLPSSATSRFPFSNLSNNPQCSMPRSAPFLTKPQMSRGSSGGSLQRRVSNDENSTPSSATATAKYKWRIDPSTQRVRSIQAADGRVLRCSTSVADQFIFTDPSIRPDEQRFLRSGRVPERAVEMLNILSDRIRKQK